MDREDMLPTEREWLIMDAVWDSDSQPTSAEILGRIDEAAKLDARTERVLLRHLCRKGLLGYVVDERDSRVYHYYPLRTREECLNEKSRDAGKEQGMDVDEASYSAAEQLLQQAQQQLGQAENREATPEEEMASALASLM